MPLSQNKDEIPDKDGLVKIFPISEGTKEEKTWQMTAANLRKLVEQGFSRVGAYNKNLDRWSLLYLGKKQRERIELGQIKIIGRDENGVVIVEEAENQVIKRFPKTVWNRQSHNAGEYGSRLIRQILPGRIFSFPKSLYAVRDALKFFVGNKPDAKNLSREGYKAGDEEWEKLGVARYVTWARTVCSVKGCNVLGEPLKGNYLGSEIAMADGFKTNVAYFKLGFLDKNSVALGNQFKKILPVIWLKSGGRGECPIVDEENLPPMMIFPENKFSVLLDERFFYEFEKTLRENDSIDTAFIVTDSEGAYNTMRKNLKATTYQLYKNYLENFKIIV